jgi:hypothetical protein
MEKALPSGSAGIPSGPFLLMLVWRGRLEIPGDCYLALTCATVDEPTWNSRHSL